MTPELTPSPYVGLRPFREEDSSFFFGREKDTRIISSNLLAEPLTVLYGPSGVGKSSVLQAGVVPELKSLPNTVVLYFRNWQSDSPLQEIAQKCADLVSLSQAIAQPGAALKFEEISAKPTKHTFLLLDQFEEYLLYHAAEENNGLFDGLLARLVNQDDVAVNVLIGIREDRLSKLDQRFSIRIPDLLGNTLEVQRLDRREARVAIEKPLNVFNKQFVGDALHFEIEPALVEAILSQVQAGGDPLSESAGRGATKAINAQGQIETAYLQLVLSELWKKEREENSTKLRSSTLLDMGGTTKIVQNHVNVVMSQLTSDTQRDMAAGMLQYLVTPSGTKIAQRTEDLLSYAKSPKREVEPVLNALTEGQENRILRRLSNPEQYEIFHDVLAEPILEWRRGYIEAKERTEREREQRAEAEQKQHDLEKAQALAEAEGKRAELESKAHQQAVALAEEQRLRAEEQALVAQKAQELAASEAARAGEQARAAQRLRWMLLAVTGAFAMAVAAGFFAAVQWRHARASENEAHTFQIRAEVSAREVYEANRKAGELLNLANQKDLEAKRAQERGDQTVAKLLEAEAAKNRLLAGATLQQKAGQPAAPGQSLAEKDLLSKLEEANQTIARQSEEIAKLKKNGGPTTPDYTANERPKPGTSATTTTAPTPTVTVRENPKDRLKYVWIPPGHFMMGCSPEDNECHDDERPSHQVTISKGFWIGESEVTVSAYKRFTAETGRHMPPEPGVHANSLNPKWHDQAMPIVNVTWDNAQAYCGWAGGRLPTEAEWEYAARAGSTAARYGDLDEIAWYSGNSKGLNEIIQKRVNEFGLYDTLGNVWEWVNDWYDGKYYHDSPSQDPAGPTGKSKRVLRGGSLISNPRDVRVSTRNSVNPGTRNVDVGFRCGGELFAP